MSNFFNLIVFAPLPKIIEEPKFINLLHFWLEYKPNSVLLMVECPLCGEEYCYVETMNSNMSSSLVEGIKDNERFFRMQWTSQCPNQINHDTYFSMKNYIERQINNRGWDY